VVNVGSNISYSMDQLVRQLVKMSDAPNLELQLDRSRLRAYDERTVLADISQLKRLTGWRPQPNMPRLMQLLLGYWRLEVAFRFQLSQGSERQKPANPEL
ncbi:unnamed protein product, partial [Polarella glacialis]